MYPKGINPNHHRRKSMLPVDFPFETMQWHNMIKRCYMKQTAPYRFYGQKGIRVCKRWTLPDHIGLKNFIDDMGEAPKDGKKYSLGRINHKKNYSPSNCIWELYRDNIGHGTHSKRKKQ